MSHVIQLALGAFMSSRGVKGLTQCWEAHERNQQLERMKAKTFRTVKDFETRAMLETTR